MADYTIYSKPGCTYCEQAKTLLTNKGLSYTELILDVGQVKDPAKEYYSIPQLKEKVPEARTVPQIFKGDVHVGGYEALKMQLI